MSQCHKDFIAEYHQTSVIQKPMLYLMFFNVRGVGNMRKVRGLLQPVIAAVKVWNDTISSNPRWEDILQKASSSIGEKKI